MTDSTAARPFSRDHLDTPPVRVLPRQWHGEQPQVHALVEAAREGDAAAFERLVELTHRDTFTLALRLMGDPEDASDVTQEAYLRAYRAMGTFRSDARFSTWMYRITANFASTHLGRRRRHGRRNRPLEPEEQIAELGGENDPQLRADATDLRDRLDAALADLPPKLRAVVVLRDVYDMSHEEISDELSISVGAAKVRLHRARRQIRAAVFPELDDGQSRG